MVFKAVAQVTQAEQVLVGRVEPALAQVQVRPGQRAAQVQRVPAAA